MVDSRRFGKSTKSPYLSNGLTDRHDLLHDDPLSCIFTVLKIQFLESKMAYRHRFENPLNRHDSAMVRLIDMKFGMMSLFSERELTFTFAICCRPSVCRLSVCVSATLVHPTQAVVNFSNFSMPFGTLAIR